ncbi:MAG: 50S ribosomal protein L15 [archaeon YNP-LCB-024-027]|jgi:large subunit ribosomal protein L15|nr:50S ribosomal protein L15 [Candidatus Culexarchaeum yellowstonense]
MVVRREKKSRKLRGSRYMGYGGTQHRGSGQRGGFGKAGLHKHKWSYILKYDRDYFGKHGFKTPKSIKEIDKPINLREIEEMINKGKISGTEKDGRLVIDVTQFGYTKVLGAGRLTKPIIVKARSFTEKAVEKIKEAGGEAVKLES